MRVLFCAALLSLTGCASIVNGQNQSISLEARAESGQPVTGAICKLSNDKGEWFVTTPGSTTVRRSYENLGVRCDKDAHEPGLASVKSLTKGMAYGNILFGGVIGAGVDISTGAAYDYPPLLTVFMGQSGDGIAPEVKAAQQASQQDTPAERAEKSLAAKRAASTVSGPVQAATTPAPAKPAAAAQTAAAVAAPTPAPAPVVVAPAPAQVATVTTPPPATVVTVAAPAQRVAATPAPPAGYAYKYLWQAERLPEVSACNQTRSVALVGAGPGFENYAVPCANGDSLAVRCEFGNCRVLK